MRQNRSLQRFYFLTQQSRSRAVAVSDQCERFNKNLCKQFIAIWMRCGYRTAAALVWGVLYNLELKTLN